MRLKVKCGVAGIPQGVVMCHSLLKDIGFILIFMVRMYPLIPGQLCRETFAYQN